MNRSEDFEQVMRESEPQEDIMTQHTPGPWDVRPAQRWHVSDKPFTLTTYELHGGPEINNGKSGEVNANARLIAAAPDLLEALRDALGELETIHVNMLEGRETYVSESVMLKLAGVIAKATS